MTRRRDKKKGNTYQEKRQRGEYKHPRNIRDDEAPKSSYSRPLVITGKTIGQKRLIRTIDNNKITIVKGPAGSGKTHIATAMAIIGLLKGEYDRVIITRPLVQSDEDTGFLPGDIEKKLEPYMRPIYDEMYQYISYSDLRELFNSKKLEICPFAYMRGRNLKNCFVIADECQNATKSQLQNLLTRFGSGSRMVITGDSAQSDLKGFKQGGLDFFFDALQSVPNVGTINLDNSDIVREEVVVDILGALEKYEKEPH